ncbi:cytochrome P450 [Streptomyces sp. NPDC050658]|uniref:cytochrome P450 n=1 Tax=unclassified Streptomyces TaxID=2593676 RepID=UPI0034409D6A
MNYKWSSGVRGLILERTSSWVPPLVIRARKSLFTAVNGHDGVSIPGPKVSAAQLQKVYAHPAACGRAQGSKLSDLIWYWVSPGAHTHQEQVENGSLYDEISQSTRSIVSARNEHIEKLARRCARGAISRLPDSPFITVRLRDLISPMAAEFFHELVFGAPCPPSARDAITDHVDDVLNALKCNSLRHMRRRAVLTSYLLGQIRSRKTVHQLPASLDEKDRALYLQSNIFGTGVGQLAEAASHLILALAQNPDSQQRMASSPGDVAFSERAVRETLRMYPLFGVAQRVTTADIPVEDGVIPAGSVLCFDFEKYQRSGFPDAGIFNPERWLDLTPRDQTYIPFGMPGNRPCPARRLATVFMRVVAVEVLRDFSLYSSASHIRSLPNRGPCILVPRQQGNKDVERPLAHMKRRDDWENLIRSLKQFVLGAVILLDARRKRMCQRHFMENRK